jgi:IS605 OrfB family transposase
MEQVITLVCKLQPTAEQATHLDETLVRFAEACAYIHTTLPPNIRSKDRMQALIYRDVRDRFQLSANLAIQAIRRVAMNRKAAHERHSAVETFAPTSIQYDARIFSFRERDHTVSLTLLHGRERLRMKLGSYQRGKLKDAQPKAAQLCTHRSGSYAIHIQVHIPLDVPPRPDTAIGVDLGRRDIAHTSTGQSWAGDDITRVRDRYARLRTALQKKASKGTRSTRRRCRQLLARLSGRERRFQRQTNHEISKALVGEAQTQQSMLVLEDLTGIRERTNQQRRRKAERRRSNSWAFYQLRQFIDYKAALATVLVVLVPPAYTSQMCHACLHLGHRQEKRFTCTNQTCGWYGDADYNAALNIQILGLTLTRPRGPWLHTLWYGPQGSQKPQSLQDWVA